MDKKIAESLSKEELMDKLKTSEEGLSAAVVSEKLRLNGPNVLRNDSKQTTFKLLLKQFRSSLIYLLILAAILSFLLKDYGDGAIILVILVINTGLGFYQEVKSGNAIEKLQKLVSKQVLVKRDGKETLVDEKLLVVGDLVILREGDIVPADIRLIKVDDLTVDESQLTGESVPVTKTLSGDGSMIFAGSTIEEGEGEGFIYATSANTELGKIAHLSTATKKATQYEKSLKSFSSFLVRFTFLSLALVFILKIIIGHDSTSLANLGLFIIALSITVVPEAMPVIATITLSTGAMKLAKRHVIAKTLTSVEDLGNINILCSDKTGTLTENRLTVSKLISDHPDHFKRLAIASLETLDEKRKKFQSSFDQAFLKFVPENIQNEVSGYKRLKELPFDPIARRRRVVFAGASKTYLVEIGSAETLLEITKDPKTRTYLKIIKKDGQTGLRHLGIAYKEINYNADDFDILKHEEGLKFVGFVALEDPLRPSSRRTLGLAKKLGVSIKILSGDSREVTHYVGTEVGLITDSQTVYVGSEIDEMSDAKLSEVLASNNVFARLNPEQKFRIIKLLKLAGNIVGYQGDGINDAPALKLADVAIAVNNATDVAQECADILLLRNDISVIVNGIRYGRTIFSNINKYIRYTMIGNYGNFFALVALYLLVDKSLPLLPIQLILTSLLTDIPLVTIATDNVDLKELVSPSKYNTHSLMFLSLFLGSVTAMFEIMFYSLIRNHSIDVVQTGLFLFLTISGLAVILTARNKDHFWQAAKMSRSLVIAFGVILLISIGLIYFSVTRRLFGFDEFPLKLLGLTLGSTLVYVFALDTVKVWFYKSRAGLGL
jgi:Mg2+-importing ATPase